MLSGGLVPRRPYLIVGPSGTGKTTLALEFLCEGARRGEEGMIVTLEEPPNEMRLNHRGLRPELDRVWVFDAIPDVMRYERAPFKDVAQVRDSSRFADVPLDIRKTPELTSVEVTLTALEQTIRMQAARRNYTRLVIDSLTALQYFCMKGMDEVQGAQSFLRFLSDLGPTTVLTVESPHEEQESPERMLARGEIRLFRWDTDGRTVRAIGVEKFRGSSHDVRLHPYRIGTHGLDLRLDQTIFRDGRRVMDERVTQTEVQVEVNLASPDSPEAQGALAEVERARLGVEDEIRALLTAQVDLQPIRATVQAAIEAAPSEEPARTLARLNEIRELAHHMRLGELTRHGPMPDTGPGPIPPPFPSSAQHEVGLGTVLERLSSLLGPSPIPPPLSAVPIQEPPAPPVAEPTDSAVIPPPPEPPRAEAPPPAAVPPPPAAVFERSPSPSPASPPEASTPPSAPTPSEAAPPLPLPLPFSSGEAFGPTFDSLAPEREAGSAELEPTGTPSAPTDSSAAALADEIDPASSSTAKRRRRGSARVAAGRKRNRAKPAAPLLSPDGTEPAPPKKRAPRRRKGPNVVAAEPGSPPPERQQSAPAAGIAPAAPPAAGSEEPSPAADPSPPPGGSSSS
jgi:KaiC/GvpD/RAD55 family RecA-like ATPase